MRKNSGGAAEEAAVLFLEEKGIRILERNFRSYHGEIDIIALEQETVSYTHLTLPTILRV